MKLRTLLSAVLIFMIFSSTTAMLYAAVAANEILEGEIFRMTLSKPRNGNAQHLRVTSLVPLSSCFRPVIQVLREFYKVKN